MAVLMRGPCPNAPGAGAGGKRQGDGAHAGATQPAQRPRQRLARSARATSAAEAAVDTRWFTHFESFSSVTEPTQRAQRLENSFWHHPVIEVPATRDEAFVLMERLQQETAALGSSTRLNVVAFTGGNGPALAAYLLNSVFDGAVVACVGAADSMQPRQLEHARYVSELLGIDLFEVGPELWSRLELPRALDTAEDEICAALSDESCDEAGFLIFSGATADDLSGTGSQMHSLKMPLSNVSRATVNALSQAVGLPVWDPSDAS